jgi:phosphoribosylformylglycinamidine synthase
MIYQDDKVKDIVDNNEFMYNLSEFLAVVYDNRVKEEREIMIAKIYITLKAGVLDPQGKTIHNALCSLGYEELVGVRLGKYIVMQLKGSDTESARSRVEEMCRRLLANPVIEDYRFEIEEGA